MLQILENIIFYLLIFRPIISYMNSYVDGLGLIVSSILIIMLFIYMSNKLKRLELTLLISFILMLIFNLFNSYDKYVALTASSRVILAIEIFICFTQKGVIAKLYRFIIKHKKYVIKQVILIQILLAISTLNGNSYMYIYNDKLFKGPTNHTHTLAYILILMTVMLLVISNIYKPKLNLVLLTINLYFIMQTGARVSLIIFILLVAIRYLNIKTAYFITLSILIIYVFGLIDFNYLETVPIVDKMITAINENNILSGRGYIWSIDLNYFKNTDIVKQLFGSGFDLQYNIHKIYYNMNIWSHNDFISMLLSMGIYGLTIYIYMFFKIIKQFFINYKCNKALMFSTMIIITAFFNGVYEYTDFLICIPFLFMIIPKNKEGKI